MAVQDTSMRPHELHARVTQLTTSNEQMQAQVDEHHLAAAAGVAAAAVAAARVAELQQETEQMQAQLAEMQRKSSESKVAEAAALATAAQLVELQLESEELKADNAKWQAFVAELQAEVEQLEVQLQGSVKGSNSASPAGSAAAGSSSREAAGPGQRLAELQADNAALTLQLEQLRSENAALKLQAARGGDAAVPGTAAVVGFMLGSETASGHHTSPAGLGAGELAVVAVAGSGPAGHGSTDLAARLRVLEAENAELQASVSSLRAHVAELADAESIIKEWSDYAAQLSTDKDASAKRAEELQLQLAAAAAASAGQADPAVATQRLQQLQADNAVLTQQVEQLRSDNAALTEQLREVQERAGAEAAPAVLAATVVATPAAFAMSGPQPGWAFSEGGTVHAAPAAPLTAVAATSVRVAEDTEQSGSSQRGWSDSLERLREENAALMARVLSLEASLLSAQGTTAGGAGLGAGLVGMGQAEMQQLVLDKAELEAELARMRLLVEKQPLIGWGGSDSRGSGWRRSESSPGRGEGEEAGSSGEEEEEGCSSDGHSPVAGPRGGRGGSPHTSRSSSTGGGGEEGSSSRRLRQQLAASEEQREALEVQLLVLEHLQQQLSSSEEQRQALEVQLQALEQLRQQLATSEQQQRALEAQRQALEVQLLAFGPQHQPDSLLSGGAHARECEGGAAVLQGSVQVDAVEVDHLRGLLATAASAVFATRQTISRCMAGVSVQEGRLLSPDVDLDVSLIFMQVGGGEGGRGSRRGAAGVCVGVGGYRDPECLMWGIRLLWLLWGGGPAGVCEACVYLSHATASLLRDTFYSLPDPGHILQPP